MSSVYCLVIERGEGGRGVLPDSWDLQDVPLHAHVELRQVDPEIHHVGAFNLAHVAEINLNNNV